MPFDVGSADGRQQAVALVALALLGLGLASAGLRVLMAIDPTSLPPLAPIRLDWSVVAFTLILGVATTIVFGLAPALRTLRVNLVESLRESAGTERVAAVRADLQATMDINAQVFRSEGSLKQALEDIDGLKVRYAQVAIQDKGRRFNTDLLEAVELGFLLELAEVLVVGALARNESRGGHMREDYPNRDDVNFMRHTMAYRAPVERDLSAGPRFADEVRLDYKPVTVTRYQPMERKY